jgi:hypothetical protein
LVCLVSTIVLPCNAHAQDDWKFEASINVWLPSISGQTSFPPSGGGPSVDVSTEDIVNAIKMAFMGSLDVKKGEWGAFTDVAYVDLGDSVSGTRDFSLGQSGAPTGLYANLGFDLKATAWTIAGTYNIVATPQSSLDVLAGTRLFHIKQSLQYQLNGTVGPGVLLPPRMGSGETDDSNWDAVIGFKGRVHFGIAKKWFIPYYLDLGAGESQFTWQAQVGAGYQFCWGSVSTIWRYLDYKLKSPNSLESVSFNGPAFIASFRW